MNMQPRQVGIAVAGAGRWGRHLIRNFRQHPQAKLIAVMDQCRDRLQSLIHQEVIDPERVLLTQCWDEVLRQSSVEAVAIATPASTHFTLSQAALRHQKHVLVEKPLTLEVQHAVDLCKLAETVQRHLVVDHTYLFHPAVAKGHQILGQQALGPLRYGYGMRTHLGPIRHDVDVVWDLAIHDIAILSHWLHEFPCLVQAQKQSWLQSSSPPFPPVNAGLASLAPQLQPMNQRQCEPEDRADMAWIMLTYPSGMHVTLNVCWANADKQRRVSLVGDHGALVFDECRPEALLTLHRGHIDHGETGFNPQQDAIAVASTEPLRHVCDHFLNCVIEDRPSLQSSGWLGATLVQVLSAITDSLARGGSPCAVHTLPDLKEGGLSRTESDPPHLKKTSLR